MTPSIRFSTNERTSSWRKEPKEGGIGPEKLFPVKSRYLRLGRSDRVWGRVPVSKF